MMPVINLFKKRKRKSHRKEEWELPLLQGTCMQLVSRYLLSFGQAAYFKSKLRMLRLEENLGAKGSNLGIYDLVGEKIENQL